MIQAVGKTLIVTAIIIVMVSGFHIASAQDNDLKRLYSGTDDNKPGWVPGRILVKYKAGVGTEEVKKSVDRFRILAMNGMSASGVADSPPKIVKTYDVLSRVRERIYLMVESGLSNDDAMRLLKTDPAVECVSPNYRRQLFDTAPDDTDFGQLWGLLNTGQEVGGVTGTPGADIKAVSAWDRRTDASEVVVALIDSGTDYFHQDLRDNLWVNPGEIPYNDTDDDGNGYVDDIYGISAGYENNHDPMPIRSQHGTHVTGIIGAVGNNGRGVSGVAWKARVLGIKMALTDAAAIEAIEYLITMKKDFGVNIVAVNASWGGAGYNPILADAIESTGEQGMIWVAAGGNSSNDNDETPIYPPGFRTPNMISVGALTQNNELADFSAFGPATVQIVSPGDNIYSTVPGGGYIAPGSEDRFYDDLESGADNWETGGSEDYWSLTESSAHSSSHAFEDRAPEAVQVTESTLTVNRDIDLSGTLGQDYRLGFWYRNADAGSSMIVSATCSNDGGDTWSENLYQNFVEGVSDWQSGSAFIPDDYRTARVRIQIKVQGIFRNAGGSFFIDDVGIGAGSGSDGYTLMSGTSMAAPYVTGAFGLTAAEYPDENHYYRLNRLLSAADRLDALKGKVLHGNRLNLDAGLAPETTLNPFITGLSNDQALIPGTAIAIDGILFGEYPGKVLFKTLEAEREAEIVSWSDGQIEAVVPGESGRFVQIVHASGRRSNLRSVSAWKHGLLGGGGLIGPAAAVDSGSIYVIGGGIKVSDDWGNINVNQVTAAAWRFDPENETWTSLPDAPTARAEAVAATVVGSIHVIGGFMVEDASAVPPKQKALDIVEAYDPASDRWESRAMLPRAVRGAGAVSLNGKIYLVGGRGEGEAALATLYMFDPTDNAWSKKADMQNARYSPAVTVVSGRIYVLGGYDGENYLTSVEIYDPAEDAWTSGPDSPRALAMSGAAYDGKTLFTVGGSDGILQSGFSFYQNWLPSSMRYDPENDTWSYTKYGLLEPVFSGNRAPLVFLPHYGLYRVGGSNGPPVDALERLDMYPPDDVGSLQMGLIPRAVRLTWENPVEDFAGVKVYVSKDNGQSYEEAADAGPEQEYIYYDAQGRDYYFMVRTYDAWGNLSEGRILGPTQQSSAGGGGGGGCFISIMNQ